MTKEKALKLAREIIKATNASSQFWLVPDSNLNKAFTAIEAALAQPDQNLNCKSVQARLATAWGYVKAEQEPVLLLQSHSDGYWCVDLTCKKCYSADFRFKHKNSVDKESLTTPPQRTWIGLSDDDMGQWIEEEHDVLRWAEAKLKDLNT